MEAIEVPFAQDPNAAGIGKEASHLIGLGSEGASVATTIYHFDNLIENRLLVDAFSDMARAVSRLKSQALTFRSPLTVDARWRLATRLQYIQQAVSQRYQGVYVGIEESPWGASFGIQPAGIGIQRILKSIELYALELLQRLDERWGGFVLIARHARPAMEHFEDILLVPATDALSATRYWAISHEMMHVLQHVQPERFSLASLAEGARQRVPNEADRSGKLLIETSADIMEFRLSCTLHAKEYLRVVWGYLNEGLFQQSSQDQLTSYLIRSFAVYYSDATNGASKTITQEALQNLFDEFLVLVEGSSVDLTTLRTEDERGQLPLTLTLQEFMLDVLPYLECINRRVADVSKSSLQSVNVDIASCLDRLENGQILQTHEVEHPDLIAWALARRSLHKKGSSAAGDSRRSIAWILSLWHRYHVSTYGPNLENTLMPEIEEKPELPARK